jgi:hypothetical protein
VRGAERTQLDQPASGRQPGDGVQPGDLERLFMFSNIALREATSPRCRAKIMAKTVRCMSRICCSSGTGSVLPFALSAVGSMACGEEAR